MANRGQRWDTVCVGGRGHGGDDWQSRGRESRPNFSSIYSPDPMFRNMEQRRVRNKMGIRFRNRVLGCFEIRCLKSCCQRVVMGYSGIVVSIIRLVRRV